MDKQNSSELKKQRVTAFIDPILVKRAKVRGALESMTISEVVERALEEYAPKLEQDAYQNIHLKFNNGISVDTSLTESDMRSKRKPPMHAKPMNVHK
jgi:hypothetical protein